jgi:aconitate hydratase 2/2-methylisocitrate dehydratase
MSTVLDWYRSHKAERASQNALPKAIESPHVETLVELLVNNQGTAEDRALAAEIIAGGIAPGRSEAAKVKAEFLEAIAVGEKFCPEISAEDALGLLASIGNGDSYGIAPLVELLSDDLAEQACTVLKQVPYLGDNFNTVVSLHRAGNQYATALLTSYARMEWLTGFLPENPDEITVVAFKLDGEWNTERWSPAHDSENREDDTLHAFKMLDGYFEDLQQQLSQLRGLGFPVAIVCDIIGTESSRESAVNNINVNFGQPVPYVPNKFCGGVVLASMIAPTFWDNLEDNGVLGIEVDVTQVQMGDVLVVNLQNQTLSRDGEVIASFGYRHAETLDKYRCRSGLVHEQGKLSTRAAKQVLGLPQDAQGKRVPMNALQKLVARNAGLPFVLEGQSYTVEASVLAIQDTTGGMTMKQISGMGTNELMAKTVFCTRCHTGGSPTIKEILRWDSIKKELGGRGGILLPGIVIHTAAEEFGCPDEIGGGNDSHSRWRFLSRPIGSTRGAHVAATGSMPWYVYPTVLVKFTGSLADLREGVTPFDIAAAIPYFARQEGKLTLDKNGKVNTFNNRSIHVVGLEQAPFDVVHKITDWSAELISTDCYVQSSLESHVRHQEATIQFLQSVLDNNPHLPGRAMIEARIAKKREWLANPWVPENDEDYADYVDVIEIPLAEVRSYVTVDNDYHHVVAIEDLSEQQLGNKVYDARVYSCMTQINDYIAGPAVLQGIGEIAAQSLAFVPASKGYDHYLKFVAPTELGFAPWNVISQTGLVFTEESGRCSGCMGNKGKLCSTGGDGGKATFLETSDGINLTTGTRSSFGRESRGVQWQGSSVYVALSAKLGHPASIAEYNAAWQQFIAPKAELIWAERYQTYFPAVEV